MPVSAARITAFDILLRVEQHGAYASELLHAQDAARVSSADHGLATELVMGVLRWRSFLDSEIQQACSQPLNRLDLEVLTTLRLGDYQLRFLNRVPARAAVHESVELVKRARKRSAAPLVNAVLRKLAAQPKFDAGENRSIDFEAVAATYSHPDWLVQRWFQAYGVDTARAICAYDQHPPPTAIRLRGPAGEPQLRAERIDLGPGQLLRRARRIVSGEVTRTQPFRDRQVFIQDEASQLVAFLAGSGRQMLDCCAAPGGKTAILAERNPNSLVVGVELHPHRARLLSKLVDARNVRVVCADARKLPFRQSFDVILADVPCSGTGTLARNPDIKWRLRPEDLPDLQKRQIEILRAAVAQLAPGGRLIYSTCSLERDENEDVVQSTLAENASLKLIEARSELQHLQTEHELAEIAIDSIIKGPYLRTIPGIHQCDGFFAAILQKS